LLSLCLATIGVVRAQEARGTILGRVTDSTGAVMSSAEVRATNIGTGVIVSAKTSESGNYAMPFRASGFYNITAESSGFKKFLRDNVQVRVGETVELNIAMSVGDVSEQVEVRDETPLLSTAEASLGQVVDERRVLELPLFSGNAMEFELFARASSTPLTCACARLPSTTRPRSSPPMAAVPIIIISPSTACPTRSPTAGRCASPSPRAGRHRRVQSPDLAIRCRRGHPSARS
jgi:hypothetical protein